MQPPMVVDPMLGQQPTDALVIFVTNVAQGDVHVFVPQTLPMHLVEHVSRNFSQRIQQPVRVFHDYAREKYRLCPFPPGAESALDTAVYGGLVYECDMCEPPPPPQAATEEPSQGDAAKPAHNEKPPHPRNSWILFRQSKSKEIRKSQPGVTGRELSTIIADIWRNADPEVKAEWKQKAEEESRLHKEKYPDYQPKTRKRPKRTS